MEATKQAPARLSSAEMHAGPGFRIQREIERPDPSIVSGLGAFETPDISDMLNRLYTMCTDIRPQTKAQRIIGPACTVKVFPGDNLMVHAALDIAQPGDVIVVDTSASRMTAVLGDLVCTKARHRGIRGYVVDGLIRDLPQIDALGDIPVFARGITPIGPLHRGPGEVNHAISCGGIVVHPGDIIVGDLNGVVVIPRDIAPELFERLTERAGRDRAYVAAVQRGEFSNAWVDRVLQEGGL